MDPSLIAIPAYLLLIGLEIFAFHREEDAEQRGYGLKDTLTSMVMGAGYAVIGLIWVAVSVIVWEAAHALTPLRIEVTWWSWPVIMLLVDLCYYWEHRVAHEVRIFWASHVVHHSSQYFNFSTPIRQTWTGVHRIAFLAPVALAGFPVYVIPLAFGLNLVYQFCLHTKRIGRLHPMIEFVFNTPSHHRVHHAVNDKYLDRNYGGILIVWDRMFGTFQSEDEEAVYGLTKNINTYNPLKVAFHEYIDIVRDVNMARSWKERLGYVFGRPGWQPRQGSELELVPAMQS
ncbi:sterol desaturase family protein [Streptosporangium sp. NPDC002607]